jgi:hypothetical protein
MARSPYVHDSLDDDDAFGPDGLLKDGRAARVPLMLRDADGLSEVQSARDKAAHGVTVVDGFGGTARLHQPGPRYARPAPEHSVDHAVQVTRDHMRAEAYADAVQQMCDAWRGPNVSDRECQRIHDTGNPIADAYLDQLHDLQNSWSRKR